MKRALFAVVVVLIAAAYLAGFWPQHQRLTEADNEVQALQQKLAAAEARLRVGDLLGQLLRLSDAVMAHNYGQATTLSSDYFDRVREEVPRAGRPEVTQALQRILQTRDQVTSALARTDPSVASTLRDQELTLRQSLGYPVDAPGGSDQPGK